VFIFARFAAAERPPARMAAAPPVAIAPAAPPISCHLAALELSGVLTSAPGLLTFTLSSHAPVPLRVRLTSTLGDAVVFQEWNENLGHPPTATAVEVGATNPPAGGDTAPAASSVGGTASAVLGGWSGAGSGDDGGDGDDPDDQCALFHEIGQIDALVLAPGERKAIVLVFRPSYAQVVCQRSPHSTGTSLASRVHAWRPWPPLNPRLRELASRVLVRCCQAVLSTLY